MQTASAPQFEPYLTRWSLTPDGAPMVTPRGRLLPVRRKGEAAMLKIATELEERFGIRLMLWWDGDGAAPVLEHDDSALVMERATGARSLEAMARSGQDDAASRIICAVADRLHAPRPRPLPDLVPLDQWFADLWRAGPERGGLFRQATDTARMLIASQRDICALHGDLHHGNILDFGKRGWLAIDPKRLIGERGFDYANIFCNPDAISADGTPVAVLPGRLVHHATIVAQAARLDRLRLLQWIFAFTALSAIWNLEDNQPADVDLAVMALAAAEIARS